MSYDEAITVPVRVLSVLLQADRDERRERRGRVERLLSAAKGPWPVVDLGGIA